MGEVAALAIAAGIRLLRRQLHLRRAVRGRSADQQNSSSPLGGFFSSSTSAIWVASNGLGTIPSAASFCYVLTVFFQHDGSPSLSLSYAAAFSSRPETAV